MSSACHLFLCICQFICQKTVLCMSRATTTRYDTVSLSLQLLQRWGYHRKRSYGHTENIYCIQRLLVKNMCLSVFIFYVPMYIYIDDVFQIFIKFNYCEKIICTQFRLLPMYISLWVSKLEELAIHIRVIVLGNFIDITR